MFAYEIGAIVLSFTGGAYVGYKYGAQEKAHIVEAIDHFTALVKQAEVDAVNKIRKGLGG